MLSPIKSFQKTEQLFIPGYGNGSHHYSAIKAPQKALQARVSSMEKTKETNKTPSKPNQTQPNPKPQKNPKPTGLGKTKLLFHPLVTKAHPICCPKPGLSLARATGPVLFLAPRSSCHYVGSSEPHTLGHPADVCLEPLWPHWATSCLSVAPCQQPNGCPIHSRAGWQRLWPPGAEVPRRPRACWQRPPSSWVSASASSLIAPPATIPWASAPPRHQP